MAEGGIPLTDFDRSHPYEDIKTLDELKDIFNDSTYDTIKLDNFVLKQSDKTNIKEITEKLKSDITKENINKLKQLIQNNYNIDINNLDFVVQTDLRKRILSKDGDLYLRTTGSKSIKPIQFGKNKYNAIKITSDKGKKLNSINTIHRNGMSVKDSYYTLLHDVDQTQETNIDVIKDDQGGNIDNQIDSTETLRKAVAYAHDDMITSTPINPKQRSVIEDIPRQLERSKEINSVLTDEDRQLITKYLDFLEKNKGKTLQLQTDIKWLEKAIQKAENQLLKETNEDQKAMVKQYIDSNKAKLITSTKILDQILLYNERLYDDINTKLKSKFTLTEKLKNIFKKHGLTITAVTLALGLIIDTIVTSVRGSPTNIPSGGSNNNITGKIKQSLKNFSNWLLEMSKKALDNLPAIIGTIISFLLKTTASIVGFLAEHIILFVIALAFALYEALKIGYNDIKRRK